MDIRSRNRLSKMILIAVYLGIWAVSIIVFWFFISGSDAMAYSLMFLRILLPAATFVLSVLIEKNNYWGKGKWLAPVVFGVMYMLAEYATFSAANMAAFHHINKPNFDLLAVGVIVSLIGFRTSATVRWLRSIKENDLV